MKRIIFLFIILLSVLQVRALPIYVAADSCPDPDAPVVFESKRLKYNNFKIENLEDTVLDIIHKYVPNSDFFQPKWSFNSVIKYDIIDTIMILFNIGRHYEKDNRLWLSWSSYFWVELAKQKAYEYTPGMIYESSCKSDVYLYEKKRKKYNELAQKNPHSNSSDISDCLLRRDSKIIVCGIQAVKKGNYITSIDFFVFY